MKAVKLQADYFYKLCIDSNYIRTAQIAKNIKWSVPTSYGDIEITINLTKFQKTPKPLLWKNCSHRQAIQNVCFALIILAMLADQLPAVKTMVLYLWICVVKSGICNTALFMYIIMSTVLWRT